MEFIECCIEGHVYIPHVICNGQILDCMGIDMIDSSPGAGGKVSFMLLKRLTGLLSSDFKVTSSCFCKLLKIARNIQGGAESHILMPCWLHSQ